MVGVKDAVRSTLEFVNEMYGTTASNFTVLEEVEFVNSRNEWVIVLSMDLPSTSFGDTDRRQKEFIVDADSGEVLSMKAPKI